MTTPHQF